MAERRDHQVAATCILMTMYEYRPFRDQFPAMGHDRTYRIADGRRIPANDAVRMAANGIYWHAPARPDDPDPTGIGGWTGGAAIA